MAGKILHLLRETKLGGVLTSPLIYVVVVPFLLLDLCVTIYQQVCFRVYGVPLVKRGDHVIIDRHDLAHLTWRERFNCAYCDYAQGVLAYTGEIVSRTEHFWCPVKNARMPRDPVPPYTEYIERNDTEGFRGKLRQQREKCRACDTGCAQKQQATQDPRRI